MIKVLQAEEAKLKVAESRLKDVLESKPDESDRTADFKGWFKRKRTAEDAITIYRASIEQLRRSVQDAKEQAVIHEQREQKQQMKLDYESQQRKLLITELLDELIKRGIINVSNT